jgi:hypothetical protein
MIAVCQQPNYFPWIGYIEQCARADVLVILDSVQWIKQGNQHRTKILGSKILASNGDQNFQWLTVPVLSKDHHSKTIADMKVDPNQTWSSHHWKTLQSIYGKRPFFKSQLEPWVRPWLEEAIQYETLLQVTLESLLLCFKILNLQPKIIFSSSLKTTGTKADRIVELCKAVDASTYYSGMASAMYLNSSHLADQGIKLIWQRWKHTDYNQGRSPFMSHLSILDALANAPIDEIQNWISIKAGGPFSKI